MNFWKMLNLEQMNEAQRQAVMHGEGPLLVLAGPGSGKTFTITQRILYLIQEKKVSPEEILVITFTKEAALSMQRRFMEQSDQFYPVNFGTFHSVFYHILRKTQPSNTFTLLQENQKKKMLLPILQNYLRKQEKNSQFSEENTAQQDASTILSAISFYKNTGDIEKAKDKLTLEWKTFFSDIYADYENARCKENAIDFDDMVCECEKLLRKNHKIREYWQNRFSHILMDEFQDINFRQFTVVELLAKAPYNLFAVGDDDQAIYGFRGSSPACLKQFATKYNAKQLLLDTNYRSCKEIVETSLKVINENKDRFVKQLKPHLTQKEEILNDKQENVSAEIVSLKAFSEREEEYAYLINILEHKKGQGDETCAVLFRTNAYMQGFAARLQQLGIPFEMKEKAKSIYEHFIVKDIMAYLRIAGGEESREVFLQILNKPSRYISREALQVEKVNIDTIKAYYNQTTPQWANYHYIDNIKRSVNQLEKQLQYLKKASPFLAVQYICKVIGYEKYLKEERCTGKNNAEHLEEWLAVLEWLREDAKHYDNIKDWQQAQEAYTRALQNENISNGRIQNGQKVERAENAEKSIIHLMTVHASKGLEFEKVYIPDCNEKIFPHGTMPDRAACEEERRIFYVAMTRARKSLELLYITGTKERPCLPSRFLKPLLQ